MSEPFVSADGRVAFWAALAGTGLTDDSNTSIWTWRPDTGPILAYRNSFASPDGNGTISGFGSPSISDTGALRFSARVFTTSKWTPTALALLDWSLLSPLITREVEGTPTLPFLVPSNDAGWAYARAWTSTTASLVTVVTPRGSYTPATLVQGGNVDEVFREFSQPVMNSAGAAVFRASVGPTTTAPWRQGLWTNRAGADLEKIAIMGEQAPGFPAGATFSDVSIEPAMLADGSVVFWGKATGGGVVAGVDTGIFVSNASGLRAAVIAGTDVPGMSGATFARFQPRVAGADDGSFVFAAWVNGRAANNNSGLWRVRATGEIDAVALAGQEFSSDLPGVAYRLFQSPRVNAAGRTAFVAMLQGAGVTPLNNRALVMETAKGPKTVVVRTGQSLTTSDGVARIVRAIDFDDEGVGSGRSSFSANGTLAFRLQFEDGTDALYAVTTPCPADFDGSGGTPDVSDIDAFFDAWLAGDPNADIDDSGGTPDSEDIDAFFRLWLAGGC